MSGGENITKLNAAGDQQETEFTEMPAANANDSKTRLSGASENGSETDAFLGTAKDDLEARKVDGYDKEADGQGNEHFYGLSREELEKYANDPVWVKTRRVLFAILVVGWVAMLVSAIIIVVVTEKCPKNPNLLWYQDGLAYRVDTAKFQDSDANGVGDFTGIEQHADHFAELSVVSVWLEDMSSEMAYDGKDISLNSSDVGTMEAFENLTKTFNKKGIRVGIGLTLTASQLSSGDGDVTLKDVVRYWAGAGAELFVVDAAEEVDDKGYLDTLIECQEVLDIEYNKKDDRNRVMVSSAARQQAVNGSEAVMAAITVVNDVCTGDRNGNCVLETLKNTGMANDDLPWKVVDVNYDLGNPACNLALRLTIPGTPIVASGTEIGLAAGGFMIWNDTKASGFTNKVNWTMPSSQVMVDSVLAQKSAGYDVGSSIYSLFKDLAAVRAEQRSLQWGKFLPLTFGGQVQAFVREADKIDPVVVAVNPGDDHAGSLEYGDFTRGEVLVTRGLDLAPGDEVDLNAVFMPSGGVFVAKMMEPEKP